MYVILAVQFFLVLFKINQVCLYFHYALLFTSIFILLLYFCNYFSDVLTRKAATRKHIKVGKII